MNCERFENNWADYSFGELTAEEQAEFSLHLRDCKSCQAELEEIHATTALLQSEFQQEARPELAEINRLAVEIALHETSRTKKHRIPWMSLSFAATALFAISAGVYFVATESSIREAEQVVAQTTPNSTPIFLAEHRQPNPEQIISIQTIEAAPIPIAPELEMGAAPQTLVSGDNSEVPGNPDEFATATRFDSVGAQTESVQDQNSEEEVIGLGQGSGKTTGHFKGSFRVRHNMPVRKGSKPRAGATSGYSAPAGPHNAGPRPDGIYAGPIDMIPPRQIENPGSESYQSSPENQFRSVMQDPLSTFSVDVDTASYSNIRRFLNQGSLPPKQAVRIEEMLNYFSYDYLSPMGEHPMSVNVETARCPWNSNNQILLVGIQAKKIEKERRAPCNLVFLIDVSGSMAPANRLPLLKSAMKELVQTLNTQDRVGIVTYANSAAIALPSTSCERKEVILEVLEQLQAGGGTNGGAGIQMAYDMAANFQQQNGINRVILATDGDFNVGITDTNELVQYIQERSKRNIFLSVFGFGIGNLKDDRLETLADKGNGHYAYIDTFQEARKALFNEASATLQTIAKDVKIQIEFNPAQVGAYRLIGYENRALAARDFNDDQKDAGEMGAGHSVTALYELVPARADLVRPDIDPLKYQANQPWRAHTPQESSFTQNREVLTLKVRYKNPQDDSSKLLTQALKPYENKFESASNNLRFAASVAAFGMILQDSSQRMELSFDDILRIAEKSRGQDASGYRAEFISLVRTAQSLSGKR